VAPPDARDLGIAVAAGVRAAEELDELGRRPILETLGRNIFRRLTTTTFH
jgi:hypothetical protein